MTRHRTRFTRFGFLLTILVIYVHAVGGDLGSLPAGIGFEAASCLQNLLGSFLGQFAVPGFFCLSGYLFYVNTESEGDLPELFARKLKRRLKSLVVPFIVWNIIYYIIYIAAGRASIGMEEFLRAAVFYRYNPVFWYLSQLIRLSILAPFIYIFVRKRRAAFITLALIFAAAVFYESIPFHIVNEDACFYYVFGATAALHTKKQAEQSYVSMLSAALPVCMVSLYLSGNPLLSKYLVLSGTILGRMSGLVILWALFSMLTKNAPEKLPLCMRFNFLIYAVHYLLIRLMRAMLSFAGVPGIFTETAGYLFMPVFCVSATVVAGCVLTKYAPGLFKVLTGWRKV